MLRFVRFVTMLEQKRLIFKFSITSVNMIHWCSAMHENNLVRVCGILCPHAKNQEHVARITLYFPRRSLVDWELRSVTYYRIYKKLGLEPIWIIYCNFLCIPLDRRIGPVFACFFGCAVYFCAQFITGFMTAIGHTLPWGVLLITIWFAEKQGQGHDLPVFFCVVNWRFQALIYCIVYLFVEKGQLLLELFDLQVVFCSLFRSLSQPNKAAGCWPNQKRCSQRRGSVPAHQIMIIQRLIGAPRQQKKAKGCKGCIN